MKDFFSKCNEIRRFLFQIFISNIFMSFYFVSDDVSKMFQEKLISRLASLVTIEDINFR